MSLSGGESFYQAMSDDPCNVVSEKYEPRKDTRNGAAKIIKKNYQVRGAAEAR
jgi:hypothetical protein